MAVELFNNGKHIVHAFYDLVDEKTTGAVQCNQFLIVDNGHSALIDPGGNTLATSHSSFVVNCRHGNNCKNGRPILKSTPDYANTNHC